jgi:hypothetical protein
MKCGYAVLHQAALFQYRKREEIGINNSSRNCCVINEPKWSVKICVIVLMGGHDGKESKIPICSSENYVLLC